MNEELTTQESLPTTMQEAYDSLMESIDGNYVEEFNREGEASISTIDAIRLGIRDGFIMIHGIIPLSGVAHTYRIVYSVNNGEPLHIYVNEHFKNIISEAWDSVIEISANVTEDEIGFELSEEEQAILDQAVEEAHQEIPTNSATLLVDDTTSRFSSAIWYENIQKKVIILAGIGGIGSYLGFLLARMKPAALYIYDDDIVEAVNMSGQLYGQNDLGRSKVSALANMIRNYANYGSTFAVSERFTSDSEPTDIMICGFDNMEARRTFYTKWKFHVNSKPEKERANCLFIDGRLAAEEFQVLCIKGDDVFNMSRYETEYLFSDSEADATICSYKQTTFCANMIASYMVNLFVNFCANQLKKMIYVN